jgi:hypothetical protein
VIAAAELIVGADTDLLAQPEHPILANAEPGATDGHLQPVRHRAIPGASADATTRFEHDDPGTCLDELPRRRQPGEAGADDTHVRLTAIHVRSLWRSYPRPATMLTPVAMMTTPNT